MKCTRVTLPILCSFFFTFNPEMLHSQGCCTPGTSALGGTERGITGQRTLNVSLNYEYDYLGRSYQGKEQVEDVLHRTSTLQAMNFGLEYGIADRISVVLLANYSFKRREITATSAVGSKTETTAFDASGIGDFVLLGKYQLISPTLFSPFELGIGAGAKLPTGSYSSETNGSRLSIDLQPGTGAPDLIGWLFASWNTPSRELKFYGSMLYRYAGANPDGYKFGDEWLPTLGIQYTIVDWLDASVLVRGRFAGEDFAEKRFLPSTGGRMYSVVPMILYREDNIAIRLYDQIPFSRNLNGTQLSLTELIGVELQAFFDFRGTSESAQ